MTFQEVAIRRYFICKENGVLYFKTSETNARYWIMHKATWGEVTNEDLSKLGDVFIPSAEKLTERLDI